MRRFKLTLQYDGTNYYGLQRQDEPKLPTIEDALCVAFEKLTGSAPETLGLCGRTDKGVHAKAMPVHADHETDLPLFKIKGGLNHHLPHDIAVLQVEEVTTDFHARFLAQSRSYTYIILNHKVAHPLWHNRACIIRDKLDIELMKQAAKKLKGDHDFSAFRSSSCQAQSAQSTLTAIDIEVKDELIYLHVTGHKFLHNMIRIIAGTLCAIGAGKMPPSRMDELLQTGDRTKAGTTLSPCGLYFTGASYPPYKTLKKN